MTASVTAVRLRPEDTVAVVSAPVPAGTELRVGDQVVKVAQDVPAGHKVAVAAAPAGSEVRKYGQVIGLATVDIRPGEHVHTHNLASLHVLPLCVASLRQHSWRQPGCADHTRGPARWCAPGPRAPGAPQAARRPCGAPL